MLFEALLKEIPEEIHHFAGWGGGLKGCEIVNKHFVNKLAFPKWVFADFYFWATGFLLAFSRRFFLRVFP